MGKINLFVEGLDPTGLNAIGASELLQMVRNETPASGIGLIYTSPTAPDLVSNPSLASSVWIDTSISPPILRLYISGSWTAYTFSLNTLNGNILIGLSVDIAKIKPGNAFTIPQTNAAGTAVNWINPANLFQTGAFPIANLEPGTPSQFLRMIGANVTWTDLTKSDITNVLGVGGLSEAVISPGTDYYVLSSLNGGALWLPISQVIPNRSLAANKISPSGGAVGDVLTLLNTGDIGLQTPSGGGGGSSFSIPRMTVFNTSSSFTIPIGVSRIRVKCWGAGGGGQASGGGGGEYAEDIFSVTANDVHAVTVGVGGAAGSVSPPALSTDGTASSFGALITANGGKAAANGSAGGSGSLAANEMAGQTGIVDYVISGISYGGNGGNSAQGGAGGNGGIWIDGFHYRLAANGLRPGGGGGGYPAIGGVVTAGAGANGRVIVEY